MEFETGSELDAVDELREAQAQIMEWLELKFENLGFWPNGWFAGWPLAKRAVMEAESEVQQFAVSWAEAWARAEARAWAEVKARMARRLFGWESWEVRKEAKRGAAGALLLGAALGEARAYARGERVPDRLADPPTIARMLTSLNQSGLARSIWDDSLERREDYWYIIPFIAPIIRLPIELLRQIFLAIIEETNGSPLALMLVCKQWDAIVTSIWSSLNLGTTTPIGAITRRLERSQWLLDIVVDTDSDRDDFTSSGDDFEAIFAAIEATSRWRSFVIKSFPAQADLQDQDLVNRHFQRHSNATMSRFTTFKIKSTCETSPLLNGLLHILGTTAGPALTTVEINSPNVISFLTPAYSSFFHSVKVLSLNLDAPGIHDPVDLLPHLHQLEEFTVSHLSFPTYPNHVELPFVHTLRHLSLRAASIQWMSGRIFHALEYCALMFPHHQHVLHTFSTTFPNCNHLTFQGYPLKILGGVSAHKLSHLSVTCSGSFNRRGSRQLVWFSAQVLGEHKLTPKSLHISIQATSQAWMSSLVFMSDLEELVIWCAQPSSLGATVFQSLVLPPVHASNMGMTSSPGELGAPMCPSLRRFGLKYDRWLRQTEQFDLIFVLASFIQSRQHSNYALESVDLWTTSYQKGPLELVERLQMSVEGFRRLAEESETTNFRVIPLTPKIAGVYLYSRHLFTSQITLNRRMRYNGIILAPALSNESQLVLRCRAECWSCSSAKPTARPRRCRPAFDLEPVSDRNSDRRFELKLRQDKSDGPLFADVSFAIPYRLRVPEVGDQGWRCGSKSLM